MTPANIIELVQDELIPASQKERRRLDDIDQWLSTDNPLEAVRREGKRFNAEKAALTRLSYTPILRLIVDECAQQMDLEGCYSGGRDMTAMFLPWERNGLPTKQGPLWRAAIGYGYSYTLTTPGFLPGQNGDFAAIRAYSPREMFALYGDVVEDEWPLYALRTITGQRKPGTAEQATAYRFIDEEAEHFLGVEENGRLVYIEARPHGVGVTPLVRWCNDSDLEGRSPGDVERFKVPAERLLKTTEDRLLIQHHNSWRVKYATGLDDPGSPEAAERQKVRLAHEDMLTGGDGVSFGSLPETTMDGIIRAGETDLDTLAALSQTPSWTLRGGDMVNLAADAISEARSTARLKVRAKKRAMGRAAAQNLRLAAHVEGRADDAADFGLRMQWADIESRSMSQAADALGKMADQLGVPPTLLWEMIPGISSTKAAEWRAYAEEHPSEDARMARAIERLSTD